MPNGSRTTLPPKGLWNACGQRVSWTTNVFAALSLRTNGVSTAGAGAPADEALAAVDDNEYREVLAAMLREKSRTVSAASDYERYQKLIRFALGRGFEIDVIKDCLNENAGL